MDYHGFHFHFEPLRFPFLQDESQSPLDQGPEGSLLATRVPAPARIARQQSLLSSSRSGIPILHHLYPYQWPPARVGPRITLGAQAVHEEEDGGSKMAAILIIAGGAATQPQRVGLRRHSSPMRHSGLLRWASRARAPARALT